MNTMIASTCTSGGLIGRISYCVCRQTRPSTPSKKRYVCHFAAYNATTLKPDYVYKIRQSSSRTENKYIRLIHNGRVLEDPKTLKEYGVGKIVRTDSKAKLEPPSPVYFHCSLSDYTPETPSSQNVQCALLLLWVCYWACLFFPCRTNLKWLHRQDLIGFENQGLQRRIFETYERNSIDCTAQHLKRGRPRKREI